MNSPTPAGPITSGLWDDISVIRKDIMNTGFVKGLTDGTLDVKKFSKYIAQDILYLRQDNEALSRLAGRSPLAKYGMFFIKLAAEGILSEKIMLEEYLPLYNIVVPSQQNPVFEKYGKFLLGHSAHSAFEVAAAALLPCFWVYAYTGNEIKLKSIPENRYQRFIVTYASVDFNNLVAEYINVVEELGLSANHFTRDLMKKAFRDAAELELQVFNESSL